EDSLGREWTHVAMKLASSCIRRSVASSGKSQEQGDSTLKKEGEVPLLCRCGLSNLAS
ncbi:hypothetical protein P7K49_040857, partial [Saguinus oedipus]